MYNFRGIEADSCMFKTTLAVACILARPVKHVIFRTLNQVLLVETQTWSRHVDWLQKQGEITVRLFKLQKINSALFLCCSRGKSAAAESPDYQARPSTSSSFVWTLHITSPGSEVTRSLIHWHTPNVRLCKSFGRCRVRSDETRTLEKFLFLRLLFSSDHIRHSS